MKEFKLKFAKNKLSFNLSEKNYITTLEANEVDVDLINEEEVKRGLNNPIGTKKLSNIVNKGETVVIVTSDITRPMPSKLVLPKIIKELKKGGIEERDIKIVLALGSHRKHTEAEKIYLVGEKIFKSEIKVIDSDVNSCVRLGMCTFGTPVDIFKPVAEADRVICLGNIEFHYFAGYSGGIKAIMPGVSSWEAIQANHSNMVEAEAYAGNYETNPVRLDIDEVANFFKVDFILNVVLDEKKNIVKAVAGDVIKAHREGCKIIDKLYGVRVKEKVDIVVVSPGGFPKDLNLYQAQKAIDNSSHALKDSGIMVLVASAKERFGEKTFEDWMLNKTPDEMIISIRKDFKLGGHKAAAIAGILKKNKIFLISELDDKLVRQIGFYPFNTVQCAIDEAIREKGENAKVIIIPAGGSILPIVYEEKYI